MTFWTGFLIFIFMMMVYGWFAGQWKLKMVDRGMEEKSIIDSDGNSQTIWVKSK